MFLHYEAQHSYAAFVVVAVVVAVIAAVVAVDVAVDVAAAAVAVAVVTSTVKQQPFDFLWLQEQQISSSNSSIGNTTSKDSNSKAQHRKW